MGGTGDGEKLGLSLEEVCLQCRRPGFDPWVRKISKRRKWQPTPLILLGKFHGRRSLMATVHGVAKSRTWLSEFPFLFLEGRALLSKALIQLSAGGWGCTPFLVVVCLRLYHRVNGEFLEDLHQWGFSCFCGEPLLTYTPRGRPSNMSR